MDPESQRRRGDAGVRAPLLQHTSDRRVSENIYDRPLPCCGCGIGWCSFLMGFLIPLAWYYGTFLFFTEHYRRDPRERPGLATCAIAALVNTVGVVITAIVLLAEQKGYSTFMHVYLVKSGT